MNVSRKFRERPHMKAIFISRYQRPVSKTLVCSYDMAILSDDDRYLEYAIEIDKDKNLSYYQLTRFRSIFNKWKIDIRTQVVMTNTITVKNPLYIFFQILSHQLGFTLVRIDVNLVARSIARECRSYVLRKTKKGITTSLPASTVSMSNIRIIWRKLIANGRCPWINENVDRYIRSRKDNDFIKRKQWVRLGGLYMVFRTWRKGYNDRMHIREMMLTDRQLAEAESDAADAIPYRKMTPRFYGKDDPLLKELQDTYGIDPTGTVQSDVQPTSADDRPITGDEPPETGVFS